MRGLGLLIIAGALLWFMSQRGKAKAEPQPEPSPGMIGIVSGLEPEIIPTTQPGTEDVKVVDGAIVTKPPSDIQLQNLGAVQYARFTDPIDLGDGRTQWGVTRQGFPVVAMNPPESYDPSEWLSF